MTLTVDFWQLIGVLITLLSVFLSVMIAAGKMLINQFERRLDTRFSAQDVSRIESQKHWDAKFTALEKAAAKDANEWHRIEREMLTNYVRRDDYIRNQTIIEAKIDGMALRFENAILKGDCNA